MTQMIKTFAATIWRTSFGATSAANQDVSLSAGRRPFLASRTMSNRHRADSYLVTRYYPHFGSRKIGLMSTLTLNQEAITPNGFGRGRLL